MMTSQEPQLLTPKTPSSDRSGPSLLLPDSILKSFHSTWTNSFIIKLMGKSLEARHLRDPIKGVWTVKGNITLIGLGKGFYSCKVEKVEDFKHVEKNGSWFIHGHFLHVQKWVPGFNPSLAKITSIPTWIILPELPIELHRSDILEAIGNKLGGFIKADPNGLYGHMANYARISINLDQRCSPPSHIWIGDLYQEIKINEKPIFCDKCKSFCNGNCQRNMENSSNPSTNQGTVVSEATKPSSQVPSSSGVCTPQDQSKVKMNTNSREVGWKVTLSRNNSNKLSTGHQKNLFITMSNSFPHDFGDMDLSSYHSFSNVVNFANNYVEFTMLFELDPMFTGLKGESLTTLSSKSVIDENSFDTPRKVYPISSTLDLHGKVLNVSLAPHSFVSFDFSLTRNV